MILRLASITDAPALLEIYRPYVENTTVSFETEVPSLPEFEGRIREYSKMFPYLVAEEDGVILGYAYAHAFHERAAYGWTVETTIYIREDARTTGIGRRLYGTLLPLLKEQGVKNACAVVTIPNDPSMAFHQAMGFETGNLLPGFGYKNGTWCGVAYLYRSLGPHEDEPKPVVPLSALPRETVEKLLK